MAQFGALLRALAWAAADYPFPVWPLHGSFAAQAAILDHSSTWSGASSCQASGPPSTCRRRRQNALADACHRVAFNAGFEHRLEMNGNSRDAQRWMPTARPVVGWDVPPDVLMKGAPPASRPAQLAAFVRPAHPQCINDATRWLQAGSCWSNWGSGIGMPVWPS